MIHKKQTPHQRRVEQFMAAAHQQLPILPVIPDAATRLLRARLILEEALETIYDLGCTVTRHMDVELRDSHSSLEAIADGCADLSVVTMGTLSACGLWDEPILRAIDLNNFAKFNGNYKFNEGKLIKPIDHKPPQLSKIITNQINQTLNMIEGTEETVDY